MLLKDIFYIFKFFLSKSNIFLLEYVLNNSINSF